MLIRINKVMNSALEEISQAKTTDKLESIRLHYLGRDGKLPELMSEIKSLKETNRREVGYAINSAKSTIEKELDKRNDEFSKEICESS
jgi:phenylalanyl-tRNA synthetase alpha chain